MQVASIVSERFGFKIPGGYVRMTEAGLLGQARSPQVAKVGKPSKAAAKTKTAKPKAVYSRARALAACDLQWLSGVEIAARIVREELEAPRLDQPLRIDA